MSIRPRRRPGGTPRRQPLSTFGLLRPLQRREDEAQWQERLQSLPALRREYRSGLLLQLAVIGALVLACAVLLVQSLSLVTSLRKIAGLSPFAWFLPALVAVLGAVALRRWLHVLAEFRRWRRE